ncbi:MAG: phosphotransferase [Candidatus Heimdallarchaeota archaeon]|nr:phosphotransferase [Candidatus Heimdallarchaeota archaeon]MCK5408686.1 phosphotransferase [Candidatus Heimdallarchaeota archaeon]
MNLSALRMGKILENYFKEHYNSEDKFVVKDIQSLAKGWQTDLFSFTLYRESNNEKNIDHLILRMYPGKKLAASTKHEFEVLQALFESGYPVPKTHILELNEEVLGHSFIIMERIVGEDMGEKFIQIIEQNDQKAMTEEILPQFVRLFVQLHELNWKILANKTKYTEKESPYFFIDRSLNKLEKQILDYKITELLPLLNWLKENRNKASLEKVVIVHSDFHPHNIVLDVSGKGFVIDWPGAYIGDYREDLGWTLMLMEAYTSREVTDAFLQSYEKLSGKLLVEINYFIILSICYRLFEVIVTIKLGSEGLGFREEAVEQIKETAYHIRNLLVSLKEKIGLSIPETEKMLNELEHR